MASYLAKTASSLALSGCIWACTAAPPPTPIRASPTTDPPPAVAPIASDGSAPASETTRSSDDSVRDVSASPQTKNAPEGTETLPSGLIAATDLIGGPAPGPDLPKGTRVLHVGDSFAGALGIELNRVFAAAGVKGRLDFEQSTYIPTWAHSAKLAALLASFKPDLVLISLGANELENPEPQKRAALVQKLVKSLGETPCVWIAPVLWEGAKSTLLEVIRANVGSCVYLDSNAIIKKMPRAGDRIHPSMAARPDWAAVTARWLAYHRTPTEQQPWKLGPSAP